MVTRRQIFYPAPISPQIPKFCITIFLLETLCSRHYRWTAATNFLHNLGTESRLPKTTLRAKINGVWVRGATESQKMWDPLFISAIIRASNFIFGTQLGFGE